jgi:hypothetical protein
MSGQVAKLAAQNQVVFKYNPDINFVGRQYGAVF